MRHAGGRWIVETPLRDWDTEPYVDLRVRASTDLQDWTITVPVATDAIGKPANCDWYEPTGTPPARLFFRLEAEMK